MSRTNIDIDDDLISEVMSTYHLRTKREAVDVALRRMRRPKPLTTDEVLAMFDGGDFIDPDYDLGDVRAMRTFDDPIEDNRSA